MFAEGEDQRLCPGDQLSCPNTRRTWLRSRDRGWLNKSCGEKQQVYSHLRALPSRIRALRGHLLKSCPESSLNPRVDGVGMTKDLILGEDHVLHNHLTSLGLTLVIPEDVCQPPPQEPPFLLMSPEDFLRFIQSHAWGECLRLRVVSGQLVTILQAALYNLEYQRRINSSISYVNLNSQLPDDLSQISDPSMSSPGHTVSSNPTSSKEKPVAEPVLATEKVSVEMVLYDKAEPSNIPYMIHDHHHFTEPVPVPRQINRQPYSLIEHSLTKVRLPPGSEVNIGNYKQWLESQLSELSTNQSDTKFPLQDAPPPDKTWATTEHVENMAATPYLVPEAKVVATSVSRHSKQDKPPGQRKPSEGKPSITESGVLDMEALMMAAAQNDQTSSLMTGNNMDAFQASAVGNIVLPPREFSTDSYIIRKSPPGPLQKEEPEPKSPPARRLQLARHELYVTSLYRPRIGNAWPIRERLDRRRIRCLQRSVSAARNIQDKPEIVPKRLPRLSSGVLCRKMSVPVKAQRRSSGLDAAASALRCWEEYHVQQETVEMHSSVTSRLTDVVSHRLAVAPNSRPSDKTGLPEQETTKTKPGKNKNKNNPNCGHGRGYESWEGNKRTVPERAATADDTTDSRGQRSGVPKLTISTTSVKDLMISNQAAPNMITAHNLSHLRPTVLDVCGHDSSFRFNINQNQPLSLENMGFKQETHVVEDNTYQRRSPTPVSTRSDYRSQRSGSLINSLADCEPRCVCQECQLTGVSDWVGPHDITTDFPLLLGRLDHHFAFLKCKYIGQKEGHAGSESLYEQTTNHVPEAQNIILTLLDSAMIRKEVVSSSVGHTYITFTFLRASPGRATFQRTSACPW